MNNIKDGSDTTLVDQQGWALISRKYDFQPDLKTITYLQTWTKYYAQ